MTNAKPVFTYRIQKKTGTAIKYEAIDQTSGDVFDVSGTTQTLAYPEIENQLRTKHSIDEKLVFQTSSGDKLEGQTITYERPSARIIIEDQPRTVAEITKFNSP